MDRDAARVDNTFDKITSELERYSKVFRQGGGLEKAVDSIGGDIAWFNDIRSKLDDLIDTINDAHMYAMINHADTGMESADLSEEPNEGNEFSGALAQAKQTGKKEFEVDGKKYKVQEGSALSPKYIKHLQLALRNWQGELSRNQTRQLEDILNKLSIADIKKVMNSDIPHLSQMAKLYLRNKTPGGMKNYSENNMFMSAVGKPYEDEDNPVKDAIMHRLGVSYGMEDLLKKYGLDRVEAAIDDVASFHDDAEELGSSDISIMVKQVMDNLESTNESLDYLKKLAGI